MSKEKDKINKLNNADLVDFIGNSENVLSPSYYIHRRIAQVNAQNKLYNQLLILQTQQELERSKKIIEIKIQHIESLEQIILKRNAAIEELNQENKQLSVQLAEAKEKVPTSHIVRVSKSKRDQGCCIFC